jgi:hypothetical protein
MCITRINTKSCLELFIEWGIKRLSHDQTVDVCRVVRHCNGKLSAAYRKWGLGSHEHLA